MKNLYDASQFSTIAEVEAVIPRVAQILMLAIGLWLGGALCPRPSYGALLFKPEVCSRLVAKWRDSMADSWLKKERFPRLSHGQQKVLAERLAKARTIRRQIIDLDNDAEAFASMRREFDQAVQEELDTVPEVLADYIRLDFGRGAGERALAKRIQQMRQLPLATRLLNYFPTGVDITRARLEILQDTAAIETHMLWYMHDFYKALGIIQARDQMDGIRRNSERWVVLAAARFAAGLPNDAFDETLPWTGRARLEDMLGGPSTYSESVPELGGWNSTQDGSIFLGPRYMSPADARKIARVLPTIRGHWVPEPVTNFLNSYLAMVDEFQLRPIEALGAMEYELSDWANPSRETLQRLDREWLAPKGATRLRDKDKDEDGDLAVPE